MCLSDARDTFSRIYINHINDGLSFFLRKYHEDKNKNIFLDH